MTDRTVHSDLGNGLQSRTARGGGQREGSPIRATTVGHVEGDKGLGIAFKTQRQPDNLITRTARLACGSVTRSAQQRPPRTSECFLLSSPS